MIPSLTLYPKTESRANVRADAPTIEVGLPRIPRVRRIGDKRRPVWTDSPDDFTPGGGASLRRAA